MQGEIDERVPRGGHSLMTVFGAPGAILGFLFYLVVDPLDRGDGPEAVLTGLAVGLAVGSAAYFLTVLKGQVLRAGITGLVLGAIAGGLIMLAYEGQAFAATYGALPFLAIVVLLTVALPFIRAASKHKSFFDYRPLYADAWTLPAIVGVAQVFVLVGIALAALVAALFAFIGLGFLRDIMTEPWFMLSYAGLLEAVGIGVVRQREAAILAVRGIKMALIRVTAPVFAACATIFVGAVMIRGFGSLIEGLSPVGTLTASAAAAIIMINAIVADEGRPQNALFGATSRLLGVILLFLMALAVYGLYMRITAEGLTPNRIMAGVAVLVFALYAPVYAAAALAERWVILRQGNIAMSAVLVLIAVFICTPMFRIYDWSVASQMVRIEAAGDDALAADLVYLRDSLGEPGNEAFAALTERDTPLGTLARDIGERPAYAVRHDLDLKTGEVVAVPEGWEIPAQAEEEALAASRLGSDLLFLQMPDGSILVIVDEPSSVAFLLLREEAGSWRIAGRDTRYFSAEERTAFLAAARRGDVALEERSYSLPVVGGVVLPAAAHDLKPYRTQQGLGEEEEVAN